MPVRTNDIPTGYLEFHEAFADRAVTALDANAIELALTKGESRIVKEVSVYLENHTAGDGTIISLHRTDGTASAANEIAAFNYDTTSLIILTDDQVRGTTALKVASSITEVLHATVRYYFKPFSDEA